MGNKICSLCGTSYNEKQGHSLHDCWGILHKAICSADYKAQGLRYKLEEVQRKINQDKGSSHRGE